jgi:hypothetical protein
MTAVKTSYRVNSSLTREIIDLHCKGFDLDFQLTDHTDRLICAEHTFPVSSPYEILMINQYYDRLTNGFKYVHAIETYCGLKGILVADRILFHGLTGRDPAALQKAIIDNKYRAGLFKRPRKNSFIAPGIN